MDHIILQIKICCFFFALKSRDKFFKRYRSTKYKQKGTSSNSWLCCPHCNKY